MPTIDQIVFKKLGNLRCMPVDRLTATLTGADVELGNRIVKALRGRGRSAERAISKHRQMRNYKKLGSDLPHFSVLTEPKKLDWYDGDGVIKPFSGPSPVPPAKYEDYIPLMKTGVQRLTTKDYRGFWESFWEFDLTTPNTKLYRRGR